MIALHRLGLGLLSISLLFAGQEAQAAPLSTPHAQVELLAETSTAVPGESLLLGLRFQPEKYWHVYWKNPGDSGLRPKIQWASSKKGAVFGELLFPTPDRIPYGPLVNFAYPGEVVYLTYVKVPETLKAGESWTVKADAKWLICKEECVPGKGTFELQFTGAKLVERPSAKDPIVALLQSWTNRLPVVVRPDMSSDSIQIARHQETKDSPYRIEITYLGRKVRPGKQSVFFFPEEGTGIEPSAPQKVQKNDGQLTLTLEQKTFTPLPRLRGVLKIDDQGFDVEEVFEPNAIAATAVPVAANGEGAPSLYLMLFFAFLGGILLNLMPCVLPVLSIKVMGLIYQSRENSLKVRANAFAYTAGILVSFWIMTAILLVLRASGGFLGWGFQMQSPIFVSALALLFFVLGLNMVGLFEIGGRWMGVGSHLTTKAGLWGSFFTGVLTTIAATPCSAPFMGTALGFALSQSAVTATAVLTMLAIGLAFPYLLFSLVPSWSKVLPKPGAWMELLKQILAFPLFGTTIWLLSVLAGQSGADAIIRVLMACLFAAAAIGLHTRPVTRKIPKVAKAALMLIFVVLAIATVFSVKREDQANAGASAQGRVFVGPPWQSFTEDKLNEALAAKKTVLVNLTAEWCVTCKFNEKLVLRTPEVHAALEADHVVALLGDWTNGDEAITRYMEKFQRNSVPVYLLYTRGSSQPEILPQVLGKSSLLEKLR